MRIIGYLSRLRCNKYKLFTLFIQAFVIGQLSVAGFERTSHPASAFGRAMSGVAMRSINNVWINPATMASLSAFHGEIFYSPSPFNVKQLSNYGIVVGQPFEIGTLALGMNATGFSLYRESFGSMSYAQSFAEDFSLGIGIQWHHVSIQRYGASSAFGIDLGAIYSLSESVTIGLSMINVNGANFKGEDDIPRVISSGITLYPIENVLINIDLIKDVRFRETYRIGMEFEPMDILTLRAGTIGAPSRLFGGIGILVSSFTAEYGVATHTDLGLTHSIGLSFGL